MEGWSCILLAGLLLIMISLPVTVPILVALTLQRIADVATNTQKARRSGSGFDVLPRATPKPAASDLPLPHVALGIDLRFVILHHTSISEPHFDLMIESHPGSELLTWQCPHNPLAVYLTMARRIGDHRAAYLEYEGEVSRRRGRVARVASGRCTVESVRQAWLFKHDAPAKYAAYYMSPTPASNLWVIEGQTSPEVGQTA